MSDILVLTEPNNVIKIPHGSWPIDCRVLSQEPIWIRFQNGWSTPGMALYRSKTDE